MKTTVYYDGDCPFCRKYVRLMRLREAAGDVSLVSLRDVPAKRHEFESLGIDLDEGMVVQQGKALFHGSEAIHRLAMLTTPSGIFNGLTFFVFSKKWLATLLYPLMRAFRNLVLLILGKQPFREKDKGESALLEVFGRFFGLFTILHVVIYLFRYTAFEWLLTTPFVLLFGFFLFLKPGSVRVWVALVIVMAMDAWLQAPLASNHTILKNFWLLAMLLGGVYAWLRGAGFEDFFKHVRPVGQALLIVMYFYGVFHKINTGFLDPDVSCAVALWREMPPFLSWIDTAWFHYLAIYGTLIAEAVIVLALLVAKTRHIGIVTGVAFHGMLALSGYAMYAVFSTLTISLHILFLTPDGAQKVVNSGMWTLLNRLFQRPIIILALIIVFLAIVLLAIMRDFSGLSYMWALIITPSVLCVALYGKGDQYQPVLWSHWHWLNVISLAFFINGAMPYMGLKTAQTLNMFSNLRLEGGISNHLVLRNSPRLFGYLDDLADVHKADPELDLGFFVSRDDSLIVYYDLLNRMERNAQARVSFTRNNIQYEDVSFDDVKQDAEEILHSRAVRKYFHFRWVRDAEKITCDASASWEPPHPG